MDHPEQPEESEIDKPWRELKSRREFLIGLGKWSKVVIGSAVFGELLTTDKEAQAWVNGRSGGGWINRRGYGGGGWINNRGYYGGGWINNRGYYGGGSWANARGGGGWANRRGGGSWVNRRW